MTDTPKKPMGRPRIHPKKEVPDTSQVKIKKFNYVKPINYDRIGVSRQELKELKAELKLSVANTLATFCNAQLKRLDSLIDSMVADGQHKQAFDSIFQAVEYVQPKLARVENVHENAPLNMLSEEQLDAQIAVAAQKFKDLINITPHAVPPGGAVVPSGQE
jgi:hypothetical protein